MCLGYFQLVEFDSKWPLLLLKFVDAGFIPHGKIHLTFRPGRSRHRYASRARGQVCAMSVCDAVDGSSTGT
jgi:hypothetical protein